MASRTNDWRDDLRRGFRQALKLANDCVAFGQQAHGEFSPELEQQMREVYEPLRRQLPEAKKKAQGLVDYFDRIETILNGRSCSLRRPSKNMEIGPSAWWDVCWNVSAGCRPIPGVCDNCYAAQQAGTLHQSAGATARSGRYMTASLSWATTAVGGSTAARRCWRRATRTGFFRSSIQARSRRCWGRGNRA